MFGISYETWKEICEMYFGISKGSLKVYLQWFPFTKISNLSQKRIESKEFFEKYIYSGGFVLFPKVMGHSENFIQKGDGSFRNSSLISPLLFLIIQAIGKEVSIRYVDERPSDIKVYYAGNYTRSRAKYGQDYDNFYKYVNACSDSYHYFIKTDITNFFENINVNELMARINQVCNKNFHNFSQCELLLIKELLLYCGNGDYPIIENSMASSYMATVVYLDEIDTELHEFIQTSVKDIIDFKIIRYVDDMYILFSSNKKFEDLKRVYNTIKSTYSSILKRHGLALNMNKCEFKKCADINRSLKRSIYDEYINGITCDLGELFEGNMSKFLKEIFKYVSDQGITYEQYLGLIEKYFHSNDIELPALSVYNYFVYENQMELRKTDTTKELANIIREDISFLSIDPKRLSVMVMQSKNDSAIKAMLNQLFIRNRAGVWNSYDTTIAIAYLIQSKFQHIDLLNILKKENPDLYTYYKDACKIDFLYKIFNDELNGYLRVIKNDKKALFLYFMYLCEQNRSNSLTAYAYYKNYFDRVSADMAFLSDINKKKKPNYKGFYKEKDLKKLYVNIPESDEIISTAHKLRNQNPLCHSSANLVDNDNSSESLKKSQSDLENLINQYMQLKVNGR